MIFTLNQLSWNSWDWITGWCLQTLKWPKFELRIMENQLYGGPCLAANFRFWWSQWFIQMLTLIDVFRFNFFFFEKKLVFLHASQKKTYDEAAFMFWVVACHCVCSKRFKMAIVDGIALSPSQWSISHLWHRYLNMEHARHRQNGYEWLLSD